MKMKVSFIILHYLATEMTSKCIDAILSICGNHEVNIVVVDNASSNGSGKVLKNKYSDNGKVHFALLHKNEGFARGNNAGYRYAVESFSPDFIVVLNNDVIIEDSQFIEKVEREYVKSPYAVLGPDIFCPITGQHQNPAHLYGFTKDELVELHDKLASQLHHYYFRQIKWEIKLLLGQKERIQPTTKEEASYSEGYVDCVLHGACFIFSRDFIMKRNLAFNPNTFLYFEEDILYYECQRDNLIMRYSPEISVKHFEDVATNQAFRFRIEREKIKKERMLQSIDVMLDILRNDIAG